MALKDLANFPPKSADTEGQPQQPQQPRNAVHTPPASHAPKIIAASSKKKGKSERVQKVAIIGPAGTGKTHKIFSLMKHVALTYKLKPEEILFEVIDLDSGIDELTDQSIVPDEYLDRISIATCQTFSEVVDATKEAFQRLHEHKEKYGINGCWIIVDNMEKAWQYPQEDYCRAVYGMSLVDRMKVVRKQQIEARKYGNGAKAEPVFNQNLDWGIITPMYMAWAKSFESAGINFLWLSPFKMAETKNADGAEESVEKFGQGGNAQKVSHIIKLYYDAGGSRCAEFIKSRTTKGVPKNMRKTDWTDMFNELAKLEAIEGKQKLADMQRDEYVSKKQVTEVTSPDNYVSADDFDAVTAKIAESVVNDSNIVPVADSTQPIDEW